MLLIVFKCLHSMGPVCLRELLQPCPPPRALTSDQLLLVEPKTNLKTRGDRGFSVAAPRLWSNLPLPVRSSQSGTQFKMRLKTHLFSLVFSTSESGYLGVFIVVFTCFLYICLCKCFFYYVDLYVKHFDQLKLF
ncbi:hypothetical protein NL108_014285 [Boleophthalmus pectinirostris]|nr:hypothetical protein NL108_014285 [Boleophthalmus pectinirostris]